MSFEGETNQNTEPTFTQKLSNLLLSKTPLDKNNGMIDVHRDGLFKAFMKKLDWAEKKSVEMNDPALLQAAYDKMLSEAQTMSFEDLESRYRTEDTEIPDFKYQPVEEEGNSIPLHPVSLN